ncbi:Lysine/arginine/ornithine-binding periplasmic protein [Burkholderia pseudomultivorans]|uniref:ABC transporter substrate-binding protein n=1 Tax=Burkholderia pseudomultivorans TaxID=1207504 RepID=A0A6P2P8F1_9BURK|nr:Lysine/arginine/ornithine-binding periplasmic protein [Burkholderia pseudomultivorans]MDR8734471.1 Lysine/arginine/ornithine-binding periplasmic protein [Burkholderia pseudomultivorans]MDR8739211.1 Lysine/arginine/ornithine-binding periplasmic protein [Burkholderia pseudomultivorans]MDR8756772.1 Lysine/arginine/ornithine-binding periplasmic protein [Burkholderia pseudomultivorans]MDR8775561.1 Lysine/arginine/ornithine-binding periplasmic protein [Burkholderia pseudomultivorans]
MRLPAKCVWLENDFDGMNPALKAKKLDAVLSSMSITPQRAEQIGFTTKIYNRTTRLVVKKGSPLPPTPESLKGKSIGVEQGTTQEAYAKAYWAKQRANVVSYRNQDGVYADLVDDKVPGVGAGIGLRKKDTDLKAKIDRAIHDRVKDGTYKRLASKYFDFDIYGS